MTTKELIEGVQSIFKRGFPVEVTDGDPEIVDEIIQRLRELDDLQKACRELLRGVRASGVGQMVQLTQRKK